MLCFRIYSGDEILADHFATAKSNATYRSKSIQNEIISCCGDIITKVIVSEIKRCPCFSILADEVQDCWNQEQIPLVIRYVDRNNTIKERFIRFILCDSGLTGKALPDKIVHCL